MIAQNQEANVSIPAGDAILLEDERLQQAQKLAALGELSAGLAHEINNPLAMIRQEAELLQQLLPAHVLQQLSEGEEVGESLTEIIRQVDRCKSITHNLLNYARRNEPVLQAVDVNTVVEDMARLVAKEAAKREIALIREYQEDLPAVPTDAPQLRQVLLNLLNNAIQSIAGKGSVTVITQRAGPDAVEIRIRDTGCGIAPEHLARVFDPFFTTKTPGQGTGLGLSISQKIVNRLGGAISVRSAPSQGTTFIVTLPFTGMKDDYA